MKYRNLLFALIAFCLTIKPVTGQATVGNGTTFTPPAGAQESYGIRDNSLTSEPSFTTRHYNRSNDLGIGGSFIGTTSPTSESSPAVSTQVATPPVQQFRLPRLDSSFKQVVFSPALQSSVSPALPMSPRSTALESAVKTSPQSTSTQFVESLPSFNTKQSVTDQIDFNIFGTSDF